MEFGLVTCCGCWCSISCEFVGFFILIGIPSAFILSGRLISRWNQPLFEGSDLIRIDFPAPPILARISEPIPVGMMIENCGEAKRCAYCHEEFEHDSARRFCFSCGSAAHEDCELLNGGCSVYGCSAMAVS